MRLYQPICCIDVYKAIADLLIYADLCGESACMTFNGVKVTVMPGDDPEKARLAYVAEQHRREAEREASGETASRAAALQRTHEKREALLMSAPASVTMADPKMWEAARRANPEGTYGGHVLKFTERWARMMEAAMARGETLQGCAQDIAWLAADIGEFMYMNEAVVFLDQSWVHGKALMLAWHGK